ncbi:class I SAM-dependent methyltransferase [Antrihabitans spumae]|jgi:SAM-dependent methyltransferase|uniref:Class I SAM-dependent methyltransferase n=1 Tax=Antrihabitans spumae TaxID=3373370 RepID=A0ABW7KEC6_9NOCA
MTTDREADANRLAAQSLAQDDPTGWFERLYAEASTGSAVVPWDRGGPNPLLVDWAAERQVVGSCRRALVVGCGPGYDAEYFSTLGFETTAFDISPTAIELVQERFPDSAVEYRSADLLDPPAEWDANFDLVVESFTVQSMPVSVRGTAIEQLRRLVAVGGELLVVAGIRGEGEEVDGPPWPLTETEIRSFARDGLQVQTLEQVEARWRAVFVRGDNTSS